MTLFPNCKGIGNDIIEIERVRGAIERHGQHFLDRLFTKKEQAYCSEYKDQVTRYAGRYAAKEAISKALGTGISEHLEWQDIEILNDKNGKPEVTLSPAAQRHFNQPSIMLSISHCRTYATAIAIHLAKNHGEETGHGTS